MLVSITQREFVLAPQVVVTFPENYKTRAGFISVSQYPRGFEPDEDEFGMLVKKGAIEMRLFSTVHE